jgi:Family of unknown function (DUF6502)
VTDAAAPPDALAAALQRLLAPVARLAVARGVTQATLDEWLKRALVQAADQQHAALPPHRRVSRITTATGIHRREVTRLVAQLREGDARQLVPAQRSQASELFYHWRTNPQYCDRHGSPAELPRAGAAPSFESLAQAITRDVHPRSLLDELLRLGLAAQDRERDTVRLVRDAFVPQGDEGRMLRALANNVGSHFDAAVDNVLLGNRRHFEQAIFADGLSDASLAEFRNLVRDQWQALIATMVPALEAMIERDQATAGAAGTAATAAAAGSAGTAAAAGNAATEPTPHHLVRLGLYTHDTPSPAADAALAAPPTSTPTTP